MMGFNSIYYEPELTADMVLFKLTGGDLSKKEFVENIEVSECYDWLYTLRAKELNELIARLSQMKK